MTTTQSTLQVTRRQHTGSRYAQRERDAGRLPAVLYGHGQDPVSLSLIAKEALRFFESGERVFNIEVAEENVVQTVLLKDIQFDYLGNNVIHVDLTRVDLTEEIESNVQLHFIGEPMGLKHAGAIMTTPQDTITIRCTVNNLPESIDTPIDDLDLGQPLHAGSIPLPEGLALASDPDMIVAMVSMPKGADEEEETGEAEAIEGEAGEPEVITEKKDEKEDE